VLTVFALGLVACSGSSSSLPSVSDPSSAKLTTMTTTSGPSCTLTSSSADGLTQYQTNGSSTTSAWAAYNLPGGGGVSDSGPALTEYTNGAWATAGTSPSGPIGQWNFTAIREITPTNVWAAAQGAANGFGYEPYLWHYDGTTWATIPLPPAMDNAPNAINGDASGDLFLASINNAGELQLSSWNGIFVTLIATAQYAHWQVNDLVVFSANNVWVLLTQYGTTAVVAQWNGSRFALHDLPTEPGQPSSRATQFSGNSPSDLWAIGPTAIWHDDGNWQPYLYEGMGTVTLSGIAELAKNFVIATGSQNSNDASVALYYNGIDRFQPLALSLPTNEGNDGGLYGLTANAGTNTFWGTFNLGGAPSTSASALVTCRS
jgi:hypothetical protein